MGELAFIGLGLHDENGLSVRGLETARTAGEVFLETYTSLMTGLSVENLEDLIGRPVKRVSRRDLEDEDGRVILEAASRGRVVLLVPGDPMIATTHVDLRIQAERMGVKTRIIHGASIVSAAIGLSGLQSYRFGRSVTIPFREARLFSEVPYHVLKQNKELGLHTLCLLDIKVEEDLYMTVNEGLNYLMRLEEIKNGGVLTLETLALGVARAGSDDPVVRADTIERLKRIDFGGPPHSIIIPGLLHFMEAEALITLAKAPRDLLKSRGLEGNGKHYR